MSDKDISAIQSDIDTLDDLLKPTVTIYVRKGDHSKERIISINPIPVDPMKLLEAGFAIDGNSATISVDSGTYVMGSAGADPDVSAIRHFDPNPDPVTDIVQGPLVGFMRTWTVTRAVNDVERLLVKWLRNLGYEVKFG